MRQKGCDIKRVFIFAVLCFLLPPLCAQDVSLLRNVRLTGSNLKTAKVLDEISFITGFVFTYDTKAIDTEKRLNFPSQEASLKALLDSIAASQSIKYSIIGKHIILFHDAVAGQPDTVMVPVIKELLITGTITDAETREPLSFATIGVRKKGKGTITNNNGEFVLTLPGDCISDTLSISYVGYSNRVITVRSIYENNLNITMERSFISIPEIIVRAQDPVNLIHKAMSRVPENYGTTPAILTGFYREGVFRKQEPQIYSEAILQVYKSPYARSFQGDQVKVIRSRKIENLEMKDTLAVRLRAGLNSCMILDGVKNFFDFTDPQTMSQYNFHMTDMVTIDGERAYVISFEQKPGLEESLFKGNIYINTDDFGIFLAEFELDPEFIGKSKDSYISQLPKGFVMRPVSVKYRTQYRKVEGRYYLSHVRGDLEFIARNRNKLFNSHFNVFFEVAYTDFRTNNVQRFDRDETTPIYSVFTKTINGYDSEFWKGFDFLKPEEDITSALEEIKARLRTSDTSGE
jgi:hypothetical protein